MNELWTSLQNAMEESYLQSLMGGLKPQTYETGYALSEQLYQPLPYDIRKQDKTYFVDISLPGAAKEDIKVWIEDHPQKTGYLALTVEAQVKPLAGKLVHNERKLGIFKRSFDIRDDLNIESVSSKYENGILTISYAAKEKKYLNVPID